LEPTQMAGFVQTFRTLIPESLAGAVSAQAFDTAGLALDLKLSSHTYLGLQVQRLESQAQRQRGVLSSDASIFPPPPAVPASTPEHLKYLEHAAAVTLNQLVSDEWSIGAEYTFTRSELRSTLSSVPLSSLSGADRLERSDLHQLRVFGLFNHPSGFFGRADLDWYWQDNTARRFDGSAFVYENLPGDEFPQLNLLAGWRFRRQRAEITAGVLNVTGQDYHLKPLNFYIELSRGTVICARLRFRF